MKKTPGMKVWSGEQIRELARARFQGLERPPEEKSEKEQRIEEIVPVADPDSVLLVVLSEEGDDGEEMELLCKTLGLRPMEVYFHPKTKKIHPAHYLGEGTLENLQDRMRKLGCSALVVDAPLSPVQIRNMEEFLKVPVLDREGVILEIFKEHAQTKLAKLQVELAQLKYLQPRLSGLWMGLSRQRGGRGGLKGRGLGESRLELDRRVVKDRIALLSRRLREAEKSFRTQSARRSGLPRVALVGYTNAGKSSLMRWLTRAPVKAENKLFSTLDTTVRPLVPPTNPPVLLSDTVGFVKRLPHDLVASFKSTLQEACESRLILHVLDVSHPHWREHFETTEEVLQEIGVKGIPRILVLNKSDKLQTYLRIRTSEARRLVQRSEDYIDFVATSAETGEGIESLKDKLYLHLKVEKAPWMAEVAIDELEK